jgi:hypothetical protein
MSIPICLCKVAYDFGDAKFPATIQHCAFHKAANELYELVDMQIALRGEETLHKDFCRCWGCRAVRALRRARGASARSPQDHTARPESVQTALKPPAKKTERTESSGETGK